MFADAAFVVFGTFRANLLFHVYISFNHDFSMSADDIAIVGVGCRFPGADDLDEFWRVLVNGENHVKEIPVERWNHAAFYNEDPNESGKIYTKRAGLLNR